MWPLDGANHFEFENILTILFFCELSLSVLGSNFMNF